MDLLGDIVGGSLILLAIGWVAAQLVRARYEGIVGSPRFFGLDIHREDSPEYFFISVAWHCLLLIGLCYFAVVVILI